ncbi:CBN-GFI-4 protein [Caenorhabditis brenneri]|uniref:CBN-GFI-4 protein n=1 Tax=Caenorhabditis brenneri TaxID=135651 RepID=G0NRS4_CAEBE|nr:CBN-GFI-4 protein [Caenorhabditis brenneri]
METALSRTGDMRIVEHIAGFYMRQDNFTKLIIREDALRCIRSIQDKASQISDHIRLAVIMMMRKFVDMTTYEFRETLRMYPQQCIDDPVEAYVMQHFVQWAYLQDKMPSFITWKDAFEQAGLAVGKWSTVETVLPINILEKTRENIQVPKSISVNSEKAGQKKREKLANEEAKLFETLHETSAADWRIYELSNFGY